MLVTVDVFRQAALLAFLLGVVVLLAMLEQPMVAVWRPSADLMAVREVAALCVHLIVALFLIARMKDLLLAGFGFLALRSLRVILGTL